MQGRSFRWWTENHKSSYIAYAHALAGAALLTQRMPDLQVMEPGESVSYGWRRTTEGLAGALLRLQYEEKLLESDEDSRKRE